jgi:Kef-type K+ transport system membrane component KefB
MMHSIGTIAVVLLSVVVGLASALLAHRRKELRAATVFGAGYVVWLLITLVPEFAGTGSAQVELFEIVLTLLVAVVISLPFYVLGYFVGYRVFRRAGQAK